MGESPPCLGICELDQAASPLRCLRMASVPRRSDLHMGGRILALQWAGQAFVSCRLMCPALTAALPSAHCAFVRRAPHHVNVGRVFRHSGIKADCCSITVSHNSSPWMKTVSQQLLCFPLNITPAFPPALMYLTPSRLGERSCCTIPYWSTMYVNTAFSCLDLGFWNSWVLISGMYRFGSWDSGNWISGFVGVWMLMLLDSE